MKVNFLRTKNTEKESSSGSVRLAKWQRTSTKETGLIIKGQAKAGLSTATEPHMSVSIVMTKNMAQVASAHMVENGRKVSGSTIKGNFEKSSRRQEKNVLTLADQDFD